MRKLYTAITLVMLTLLSACNGSSDSSDETTPRATASTVNMQLKDASGNSKLSYASDETATVIATVLNENQLPVSGASVTFSSSVGVLSQTSKLTNSDGVASVSITNSETAGASGTVTATVDGVTSDIDFEFLPAVETPNLLTISLTNSQGQAQQSFANNAIVTINTLLVNSNSQPLTNTLVNFTSNLGDLSQSSALTNSSGMITLTLENTSGAAGAGTISAATETLSANIDFEYLAGIGGSASPTLTATMTLNGATVNQFKADEQVQVNALLLDVNNQPLTNQIITFSADIGSLATATGLTDAQGIARVTLNGNDQIGAGVVTVSFTENDISSTGRLNYEVIAADAPIDDNEVFIGYFDNTNAFVNGQIKLSITGNEISAGGTLGLTVSIVDATNTLISTPTTITFTSSCVQNGHATIDQTVTTIQGTATATFEDVDCAGISGTDDVIVASVSSNNITNTASANIVITGEQLGSIEFVSAEPTSIVLKGTGGQGKQETSTLTFQVKSSLGNALAQQEVTFELDTQVGGITLFPLTGLTNSQGIITTKVTAGTVPTAVRVTARSTMDYNGTNINVQTQSDLLSVNTGLPEQRSFTLSTDVLNPEAGNINNVEVTITAQLADNFNNPVPDGTTVNFTTEGGQIQPSCLTSNGACSVTWTSAEPRVDDHRITILATALGHETFFDTNGNNTFDSADGNAITSLAVSSGFSRMNAQPSGFVDMTEAWRDDNENQVRDAGEIFIDFNNNQAFSVQDGLFNGPQCQGSKCGGTGMKSIHVRKAIIMNMASSTSLYNLVDANSAVVYANNSTNVNNTIPSIVDGDTTEFTLDIADTAFQSMPKDTTVTVSSSVGDIQGTTSFTVPNTLSASKISFIIANTEGGSPETGVLTISITSPSGILTSVVKTINLL